MNKAICDNKNDNSLLFYSYASSRNLKGPYSENLWQFIFMRFRLEILPNH
jgi:hypothetical protein